MFFVTASCALSWVKLIHTGVLCIHRSMLVFMIIIILVSTRVTPAENLIIGPLDGWWLSLFRGNKVFLTLTVSFSSLPIFIFPFLYFPFHFLQNLAFIFIQKFIINVMIEHIKVFLTLTVSFSSLSIFHFPFFIFSLSLSSKSYFHFYY